MTRFEDLEVWKRAAGLCAEIYQTINKSKDYGFWDQITRCSLSVSSNIAEAFERAGRKEIGNFLNYAKGSSGELRSQIYIGMKIGYIERTTGIAWINESREISKMIYALMQSVKNSPKNSD